ncbi:hypothetical protein A45J_1377 [hot springs metagenome]|uniref:Alginate export domain-containing protein n=1 Tax=hot springs metagenome TaxID=433727 RepID=A0A5J4L603_9ZZZZ
MKKFLAIIASLALVLGFAASAFAIHAEIPSETQAIVAKGSTQITLGGEIRVRGEYGKNLDMGSNESTGSAAYGGRFGEDNQNSKAYYDTRVRLRLQADVSKNTTGVIHLESGEKQTADTYKWGTNGAEKKGIYDEGNAKGSSLYILEAWIQHKGTGLLGIPAGIKVGHMPLKLGNGLFFDHSKFGDDALVFFMDPTKELHIGLLTAKFSEGTEAKADDSDAYVGLFVYSPSKGTSISGDVTYVDAKRWPNLDPNDKGTHLWNFGLRGNADVGGGLGIRADIELQRGKTKTEAGDFDDADGDQTTLKHRGYAYLVGLDYKLDPVKLTLEYAYGSGDASSSKGEMDGKNGAFVTALSGVQNFTYVYDYRANTAAKIDEAGVTPGSGRGISNTWYVKLGGSTNLTKDLSALVNIYYLRASKAVAINGAKNADDTPKASKNIGTEIDAKFTYKIDKNLVYFVEGGYLFAGSAYDYGQAGSATTPLKGSDDAYAIRHGIQLSF